ncbi:DNRLRE domain-containing protein [Cytobacillus pseudoceanisediminis]|uniref:DNRLRE domain-containing protein n=1 Tax=Cytobacillus pseudoceanisediminis TaxID=3051614 RepID=UPI00365ACAE0
MKRKKYIKILAAILILIPGIIYPFKSNTALGADYTSKIYPNADTFVNYGSSYMNDEYLRNSNFGDSTTIEFGRMGNRSQESFPLYSFDMKQFEGMGGIKTAYLQVPVINSFKYLDYSNTGFVAYRITDSWDEMTVTAMNRPGFVHDENPSTLYGGSSWLSINVTKSLQKALELSLPNLEIAIHPASGTSGNSWIGLTTGSREHPDQSKRSYIQVTYDNMKPEISLDALDNTVFSEHAEHNTLLLKGNVKDSDLDNTLKIQASIDEVNFQRELDNFPTTGTQQPFENEIKIDSSIPEGEHLFKVWAEDNKGAKSNVIETTIKVDKTSPSIEVANITSGNTYINEVTPSLIINDSSSFTKTIKLNNQPYSEGTKIASTGQHTLEIEAIDQVGNKSNKSLTFSVNKTPNISSPIGNQSANKYDVKEYDLNNVFSDTEGDSLSFQASSSDENIATATIDGNTLKVESLKQGTATIEVTANDGYSTSTADNFQFSVDTRPPVLEFIEPGHIIVDDSKQIEVQGTVIDKDQEKVIIQGTINGVSKQTTIAETTGNKDDWSLSWNGTDLPAGVHSNLQFQANDEYNGTHSLSYPKAIIKVVGTVNEYNPILETYSNDLSKNIQSMTVQQHEELLNAYLAMKELEQSVNPTNLDYAKQKIENLKEGNLKTDYKSAFDTKAFAYFIDNINTFSKIDLERIGIQNVVENNIPDYQPAIKAYKDELANKVPSESITIVDIQKVIDAINAVIKAEKTVSRSSIDEAYLKIEELQDNENGLLEQLKERVQQVATTFVINNTGTIMIEDLTKIGIKNVNEGYLTAYQDNLTAHQTHLSAGQIQVVIDVSNHFNNSLESLNGDEIDSLTTETNNLISSNLKSDMEKVIQVFEGLHTISNNWDSLEIEQIKNIPPLIQDENIKSMVANLVQSFEKVLMAVELLTNEAIDDAIHSIQSLKDGKTKELLLAKVGDARFDYVTHNLSSITAQDLIRAGIQYVNEDNLEGYKEYLQKYSDEKGRLLSRSDVQLIVDVVNAMKKANSSNSLADVDAAISLIKQMSKGSLLEEFLNQMNILKQKLTPIMPIDPPKSDKPKDNTIQLNQNSLELNVTFDKVKVRTDNQVFIDINFKAKKDFEDARLYLYYISEKNSDSSTVKGIEKSLFTEVKIGKLSKGESKNLKHHFSLEESGTFEIGAVLKDRDDTYQAENVINLEVIKHLSIPNVQLPTEHGLAVATITAKNNVTVWKKDAKGKFIKDKDLKKGHIISVFDTTEDHYVVGENQYIKHSKDLKLHVSLLEIRKETKLMDAKGKIVKTLQPKQRYRMYGFDQDSYYLGGGLGVANNPSVVVILGYVKIKDNISLYGPNDEKIRTLKKGDQFPVYQLKGTKMNLGGGYYINVDQTKLTYQKL